MNRSLPLLVAVVLLMQACRAKTPRAFEGPDRPDSEVASLAIEPDVRFVSLNGRSIPGVPAEVGNAKPLRPNHAPRVIRLLPGEYRIVAGYAPYGDEPWLASKHGANADGGVSYAGSANNEELLFTAAAGKRYLLKLDYTFRLDTSTPTRRSPAVYDQDHADDPEKPVSRTITTRAAATTRP